MNLTLLFEIWVVLSLFYLAWFCRQLVLRIDKLEARLHTFNKARSNLVKASNLSGKKS